MNKLIFASAVLFMSATASARAVPIEMGAFAGGHIFSSTSHLGWNGSNAGVDNSGTLGFRFALAPIERLSLESELALTPTQISGTGENLLMFGWRGHVVIHILTGRFRPFVLAGGGGITMSSSDPTQIKEDTRGEIHAGVGLKVDVRCHWGLRVDGRIQFEQAHAGIYFTEDWEIFAGMYGSFGRDFTSTCRPVVLQPSH